MDTLRETDILGRYGGKEFIVLLPPVAERIQEAIAQQCINSNEDECLSVTVSLGVATTSDDQYDKSEIIKVADQAMYKAKKDGCNCV